MPRPSATLPYSGRLGDSTVGLEFLTREELLSPPTLGEEGKPLWSGECGPVGLGGRWGVGGLLRKRLRMCHEAAREEGAEVLTESMRVFQAENGEEQRTKREDSFSEAPPQAVCMWVENLRTSQGCNDRSGAQLQ